MRVLAMSVCLVAAAASASAQTVEVGGRLGAACAGSEDSLCSGASPLFGVHASVWAGGSVEVSGQLARMNREDLAFRAVDVPVDITVTDRKRDFVSFLFVYHFMKDRPVRPMLGLGSGWYSDASRTACQPAGCQAILRSGPLLGQYRTWDVDAIFVVGLSGDIGSRWVWRGGWQSHRFGNDENSTQQFFAGAGYRWGVTELRLASRLRSPVAFGRRCIPFGGVAPPFTYSRYVRSARLADRAHRRPRC